MAEYFLTESIHSTPNYVVIGAGNGGQAMAGFLAMRGFGVNLWNRSASVVERINELGGIQLEGHYSGFAVPNLITHDIDEALDGARVIMVTVPASAHSAVAREMARSLKDGQIVVLNPGRTGGAFAFRRDLERAGCKADVVLAEAGTFIYASRTKEPGRSHVYGVKKHVSVAALPAHRTMDVLRALRPAFPQFIPAESVLATSLDNMGAIFHPAPTLLNAGRIEKNETYDHYKTGITPAVANLLQKMDEERLAIAHALGTPARSAMEWLKDTYGAAGEDLYTAIQNNPAYDDIKAPKSLDTRYITEDIPFSLIPLIALGQAAGVATPVLETVVSLAESMFNCDFRSTGRGAEEMGIAGLNARQISALALEGVC
ncbi:MAG TPA: NAD(P)-binding domain-containing protein [Firmicutes bacterium]|nr:NAD(P)-binding domain-containing protein [Candidatus Fermentithermobacillaceae bacterium]